MPSPKVPSLKVKDAISLVLPPILRFCRNCEFYEKPASFESTCTKFSVTVQCDTLANWNTVLACPEFKERVVGK